MKRGLPGFCARPHHPIAFSPSALTLTSRGGTSVASQTRRSAVKDKPQQGEKKGRDIGNEKDAPSTLKKCLAKLGGISLAKRDEVHPRFAQFLKVTGNRETEVYLLIEK